MQVRFARPKATVRNLVAEASLVFEDGPLQGLKLMGFGIWGDGKIHGLSVTFPSRKTPQGYYWLLRPTDGSAVSDGRLEHYIIEQYREWKAIEAERPYSASY